MPRPAGSPRRNVSAPGHLVDAPVVDPRLPHRHRPRRGGHLPRLVVPVAHHHPMPLLVDQMRVGVDIGGDLGQQSRGQHLPRAVANQLVEQRPTHRRRGVLVGLGLFLDYLEHGHAFPNRRANVGPDQRAMESRSSSGRCILSRHQAESHPQVLIIAPCWSSLAFQTRLGIDPFPELDH